MKKTIIFLLMMMAKSFLFAQELYEVYSNSTVALNQWQKNEDGHYTLQENVDMTGYTRTIKIKNIYNYNKKNARLYVKFSNANCVFSLTESSNKSVKKQLKSYGIPNLKIEELISKEQEVNEELNVKFRHLNDSIESARKEAERKAREDSIRKAREDSIRCDAYRRNHNWQIFNIESSLYCEECEEAHCNNSLFVICINSDSICYLNFEADKTTLGVELHRLHYSRISDKLKSNPKFKEYITMWKDSIDANPFFNEEKIKIWNMLVWEKYFNGIKKIAPYGYIHDWGWELNSVAGIEPRFEYTNTNDKTIKYIDFYFSVNNPVGDTCNIQGEGRVAHVRGVGPVETFETSTWDWDRATHYTSYDASNMTIVKLVITYINGTVKTIPKSQIIYE